MMGEGGVSWSWRQLFWARLRSKEGAEGVFRQWANVPMRAFLLYGVAVDVAGAAGRPVRLCRLAVVMTKKQKIRHFDLFLLTNEGAAVLTDVSRPLTDARVHQLLIGHSARPAFGLMPLTNQLRPLHDAASSFLLVQSALRFVVSPEIVMTSDLLLISVTGLGGTASLNINSKPQPQLTRHDLYTLLLHSTSRTTTKPQWVQLTTTTPPRQEQQQHYTLAFLDASQFKHTNGQLTKVFGFYMICQPDFVYVVIGLDGVYNYTTFLTSTHQQQLLSAFEENTSICVYSIPYADMERLRLDEEMLTYYSQINKKKKSLSSTRSFYQRLSMHKNNESEDDIEEEEDPDDYSLIYAIESLRLQFHVLPSLLLSEETTSLYELTALDPCNHIRSVLSPFLRHPSNYLPQVSSKEILAFLDVFYLRKSLLEKLVAIETFAPFLINVLVVLSSVTSNSVAPKAITLIRWVLELIIAESSDFLMQYDSVMILFFEMRTQIVLNKYQNRQKRITTSMSLISIFACLLKGFAASSVNISKGARNLYNYNVRDLRIKHCLTKVLQCIKELCVDKNFSVSESALSTLETVIVPFFLCTPHTEVIWQWCLPLLNMKLAISDHIKEMKFDSILNLIFMFTFFFFEDEGQVNESNHKRRCLIDLFYQVSVLISNGRNIMLKRTLANQFVLFCKLLNLTAVVRKIYHMNCIDQNENSGDDKKETAVISSSLSKENVLLTRHRTDISGLESPASSSTFVLEDDNERDRASLKKLVDIFFLFLKPLETESNQNISGLLFLQNQAKEERVGIMPDEPNFQDNEEDNEESRMKKDEDEFVIFFCKSAAKDLFSDSFMCEVPILKDFVLVKIVKFITIPLNVTAAAELSGSLCRFGRYLRDVNSSEKHEELFLIELFMPYLFPLFQTIQHLADEIVLEMVDNLDYVGYGLGYRMFESYFLRKQKLMLSLLAHQNHRVRLQVINQWPSLFKWFVNMAKEDNFVNILLPKSCCDPVASVRLASLDFALTCLEGWEWLPSLLSHILKEGEQKYKLRVFAVRFCQSYFLRNKHQMDIFKKNFWIGGVKFKVVSEKDRVVNVRQAACSMLDSLLPNVDET